MATVLQAKMQYDLSVVRYTFVPALFSPVSSTSWPCAHTIMESTQFPKVFPIYQLIFLLFLHFYDVQAGFVEFVNDPAQRKLCRVNKIETTCKQDDKCAWNDMQWVCNEFGYQPDLQHCDEMKCPGQYCVWSKV